MKFAVTGIDERFRRLRELLLADGHTLVSPREADMIVPPPWEKRAVYTRCESYQVANAALTAKGALALVEKAVSQSTFISDFQPSRTDRFVTLSTCSYEYDDARYVVLGRLVPLDEK